MRVLVAMSGGVDSTVVAALLKEKYEVEGVVLSLFDGEDAVIKARNTAQHLGIPLRVFDGREVFSHCVIDSFINEYECCKTPNPCVSCNKHVKFGALYDYAISEGFDYLATGHYARIVHNDGVYSLLKGVDESKDQSYMLYNLTQEKLSHILLPLGDRFKDDNRKLASALNLPCAQSRDSQEICFIPDNDHINFLKSRGAVSKCGNIVHTSGKVLKSHDGLFNYTIGQRKGLDIAYTSPLYVLDKNPESGDVTVGDGSFLFKTEFYVSSLNFIGEEKYTDLCVKTRYHAKDTECELVPMGNVYKVICKSPVRAPTAGQSAVFYDGERVVGGGIIHDM